MYHLIIFTSYTIAVSVAMPYIVSYLLKG